MANSPYKRERLTLALSYINQVIEKMKSGEYPLEETKCFCGADDDLELLTVERQGIPHRMVICKECALMRANPRMTAEAYSAFYNNEYRYINFPNFKGLGKDKFEDMPYHYTHAAKKGEALQRRLEEFDIEAPKVVVDWGCNVGGFLEPFKAAGATTYGIELDKDAAAYAESKGHVVVGTIDELIERGVKADFVIMQDLIEHLTDLREVEKVKRILAPNGHLYVWTPGFFRHNIDWYFQIAHTYQFCSRSLEYIMSKMGFGEVYCDEDVESFWNVQADDLVVYNKPAEWVEYITDHLWKRDDEPRKMPRFRGVCKFSKKLLHTNIDENLAAKFPDLAEIMDSQQGEVICLGGGPSVNEQLPKIRELHDKGIPIIAIARMYPWCLENGIVPEYVISLDCSPEQEVCFETISHAGNGTTFLLALVSRPWIFNRLKGEKCYVYNTQDNMKAKQLRIKHGYTTDTVVNGGGSVAISTIVLANVLGFKDLHVFGLDLMFPNNKKTHADGIAGPSLPQNFITATIKGEDVLTTPSFIDFANQTLDIVSYAHEVGALNSIKLYGDSLIKKMWDCEFHDDVQIS